MSGQQKVRVLHFSSRYEECGVAKYLGHYMKGMADSPGVENEYFDVSPYQTPAMSEDELKAMEDSLEEKLKSFDILHIQFEFAIYAHDSFKRIVKAGNRSGKKVVVTLHISPDQHGASKPIQLHGLGPHSFVTFLKQKRSRLRFIDLYIKPFRMADLILVHNEPTVASLIRFGVKPENIKKTIHPVQVYPEPPRTHIISKALNRQDGDVIYCTIGFLHRYKGLFDAVRALKFLPVNYKLAILGGMKEDSDDVELYNKLCDLIDNLGLQSRIYHRLCAW